MENFYNPEVFLNLPQFDQSNNEQQLLPEVQSVQPATFELSDGMILNGHVIYQSGLPVMYSVPMPFSDSNSIIPTTLAEQSFDSNQSYASQVSQESITQNYAPAELYNEESGNSFINSVPLNGPLNDNAEPLVYHDLDLVPPTNNTENIDPNHPFDLNLAEQTWSLSHSQSSSQSAPNEEPTKKGVKRPREVKQPNDRLKERRKRNREAAKKCREKKLIAIEKREQDVRNLVTSVKSLHDEVKHLIQLKINYQTRLMNHNITKQHSQCTEPNQN